MILFPGGALECNMTGSCLFVKNLHNLFREKIAFQCPVSELLGYKNFQKTVGKQYLIVLEQMVITFLGLFDQFFSRFRNLD